MNETQYDLYGTIADSSSSFTELSGRYPIQSKSEKSIFLDVAKKLELNETDRLLEIGCGVGQLLIPASFVSSSVTGVDHPKVIKRLRKRFPEDGIELIEGNFLESHFDSNRAFEKVLIYSVLHTLETFETLELFLEKALGLVAPGGRILLGDLPNTSKKERFLSTSAGKEFQKDWLRKMGNDASLLSKKAPPSVSLDDSRIHRIMSFLQDRQFSTALVSQSPNMPFGRTRDDIIAVSPR